MDVSWLVAQCCYAAVMIAAVWALTCPLRDVSTGLMMMSYNAAALAAGLALTLRALAPHSVLIGPLWVICAAGVCPLVLALRWWWAFGSGLDDDGGGEDPDGPEEDPDGPGGDRIDWDAFDVARGDWAAEQRRELAGAAQ